MQQSRTILDPELLPNAGRRWDLTMFGLLVALLAFAPAAFGAVEPWSELVVLILAAALGAVVCLRIVFDREFRLASTWLYLPLGLFIGLIVVQLVPLPASLVAWLSPATLATKEQFLGESLRNTTLSFYPRSTADHLRLVLVGTAVFVTVASVVRHKAQVKMLLTAIFAIGCANAALAIAQVATATDSIFWLVPTGRGIATAGTFVNYSHFSQFMNLSLGAGVALLLIRLNEHRRREIRGATWQYSFAAVSWEKYGWLICGLVLCAISVLTSMSRNGALSLILSAAIVGMALYRRGSLNWRGWLLGAIPLGVLAVLLVFGFDAVYERLSTLRQAATYEARWEMTADTLRAWSRFPIWGSGLGTHEFVFPMFDSAVTPQVAAHADNDYAQLLEEMGIIGAVLVAVFLIGVAVQTVRLALRGRSSSSSAAFGIAFGLIAVSIHSATDFGQRLPGVFCLSAALCGLIVAIHRVELSGQRTREGANAKQVRVAPWFRRVGAACSLVAIAAFCSWTMPQAYGAYLGERWWAAAVTIESRIRQNPPLATDEDYLDLIEAAEGAAANDPTNVSYGYWLNNFRWLPLSLTVDPETGRIVLHPDVVPFVKRIADELAAVRQLCPTFGPPYALEGQLRLFILDDARGAELIRKGVRLAGYDAPTCLVAGELAVREGKLDEAKPLLTRANKLQPAFSRDVVEIYLFEAGRPDLAREFAGDDYMRLEELASICAASDKYAGLAEELRRAATDSLRKRASAADATAMELAALARIDHQQGELDSAVELYRRALNDDYRQIDWRLELARALAASDKVDEAIREVRLCLSLRPQYTPAMQLLDQLIERSEDLRN